MNLTMNFSPDGARLVAAALLAGLVGCGKAPLPPEPPRPVLTVVLGELAASAAPTDADFYSYSGEVRSRFETPLGFRIPGKVSERLVDVGARVKPGQVLARLDPVDTALSVAAARAQLSLADAEARRYRELRGKNFVSQAALDGKETTLTAAQSQADLARNQSEYTVLKAEQAGVVGLVSAEVGQVLTVGQTVFRVARADTLEVAIAIPESRMPEVRDKHAVEVSLWADEKVIYQGVLRELSPVADPLTRTYAARVTIINPGTHVLLGMTANVRFRRTEDRQQLSVPLTALFQQDGKAAVWLVNADQTLALRPVEVASYGDQSALLNSGVKTGERIVVAGVHKLTAGEKIRIAGRATAK